MCAFAALKDYMHGDGPGGFGDCSYHSICGVFSSSISGPPSKLLTSAVASSTAVEDAAAHVA